jgi:hypothetical protein
VSHWPLLSVHLEDGREGCGRFMDYLNISSKSWVAQSWPPETRSVWPVIQPESSEARKAATGPMSSG